MSNIVKVIQVDNVLPDNDQWTNRFEIHSESSTWEDIKSAFRKLIFEHHPDRGGSKEKAQEIIAAYSILEKEYGH